MYLDVMVPWKAVGRVLAGTFTTVLLTVLTVVLLPLLGLTTAGVVGNWLPLWVFAVPLSMCAIAGGAFTGYLQEQDRTDCAMLGSLAAALGVAMVGAVAGLVALVILLGMTPAHGRAPDLSEAALSMMAVGGAAGFVAGAVLGAVGGVSAHVARRKFGS